MADQLLQILRVFEQLKLTWQQIKHIVLLLGVPPNKLDDIDGSRKDEKYAKAWLDIENPPGWGKMVTALQLLGLKAKAELLKQMEGITIAENLPMSPLTHTFTLLSPELNQADTRSLFFQLGVSYTRLDDIDAENSGMDRNKCYIQAWLDISEPKSVLILAALEQMGKPALSSRISQRLSREQAVAEKLNQ